jgi:hypothetical protein
MAAKREIFRISGCGIALGVLGYLLLVAISAAGAGGEKNYTSSPYGYGLSYPAACGLKATAEGAYLDVSYQGRRLLTISVRCLDETQKAERKGTPDLWKEFMVERAKLSCDADGPDGTVYCKKVERENTRKTTSGLRVIELYLQQRRESYGPPLKITSSTVGPIYAVDISRRQYCFGLLVGSGHEYPRTPEEEEIINKVVASVYLIPEKEFHPPKERIVTPGPLFDGRLKRTLIPGQGK